MKGGISLPYLLFMTHSKALARSLLAEIMNVLCCALLHLDMSSDTFAVILHIFRIWLGYNRI